MTKPASMRDDMPMTAEFVDRKRVEWGRAYVNDCVRRAMAGQPGYFYAMERGHTLGTPWLGDAANELLAQGLAAARGAACGVAALQGVALAIGADAAFFMREPAAGGGEHGQA